MIKRPEKKLTAAEVKKLPVGSAVVLHGCDRYGCHTTLDCTVIQSGKSKVLAYRDVDYLQSTKPIRDYPNKYYTQKGATDQ